MMNVVTEILGDDEAKGTFEGMYNKKYRKLIKRLSIKRRKEFVFIDDLYWKISIRLMLGNILINHQANSKSMLVRDIEKDMEAMLDLIKSNIRRYDIKVPHYKADVPGLYLSEYDKDYVNKIYRYKMKYSEKYLNAILMDSVLNADYELSPKELELVEAYIQGFSYKFKTRLIADLGGFRDVYIPELLD